MTKSEQNIYDWEFGRHSNIPVCCIIFYMENWDMIWNKENDPYGQAVNAAGFGYVPCPRCLGRNNRIKIKNCALECGKEHREDFMPKEVPNAY